MTILIVHMTEKSLESRGDVLFLGFFGLHSVTIASNQTDPLLVGDPQTLTPTGRALSM